MTVKASSILPFSKYTALWLSTRREQHSQTQDTDCPSKQYPEIRETQPLRQAPSKPGLCNNKTAWGGSPGHKHCHHFQIRRFLFCNYKTAFETTLLKHYLKCSPNSFPLTEYLKLGWQWAVGVGGRRGGRVFAFFVFCFLWNQFLKKAFHEVREPHN